MEGIKNRVTNDKQCLLNRVPPLPLKIPIRKLAKFKLTLLPLFQIITHFIIKKRKIENCCECPTKKSNNRWFSFSCCWNTTSLELHPGKKHPRSSGLTFLITNIVKVDFWMERVISCNNWKVPDLIYINSVCSMLYTKWSTCLKWALTEGHSIRKGGIFSASLLSLRIERTQ